MGVLNFLFFVFFLSPVIHADNPCTASVCGSSSFTVRFPFRAQGHQPPTCGYPRFDLTCNNQGKTVLNIPYSGEFFVYFIDYREQVVQLYDPFNCLPRRLLDLNLSGFPFTSVYHVNYTFLSCSPEVTTSRLTIIDCLSNSTNTVLATPSINLAAAAMNTCKIFVSLPIPVPSPFQYYYSLPYDLSDDLQLTWSVPYCKNCEAQGVTCGLESNSSQRTCLYNPGTGKANGLRAFRIICFSIAVPALMCAFAIAFCTCFVNRGRGRDYHTGNQQNSDPAAITPQPLLTIVTGLDESAIESYTKVVLGESRRLPGPNDGTCPICLSDYESKETVRCIPECKHCFHADCIDEWLRVNVTCPVCRKSPSPSPVHDDTQNV